MARDAAPEVLLHHLTSLGVNTNAYRLNTPHGLNALSGLVELIQQDRQALALELAPCSSLEQAYHVLNRVPYIRGFVGYQVLLDLYDNKAWPESFDGSWSLAGPGACRGMGWLMGQDLNYDWTSSEFRLDKGKFLQDMPRLMTLLTGIVQANWPKDWPEFTIHETEFMLCEADKWLRKQLTSRPSGRLFRKGKP